MNDKLLDTYCVLFDYKFIQQQLSNLKITTDLEEYLYRITGHNIEVIIEEDLLPNIVDKIKSKLNI